MFHLSSCVLCSQEAPGNFGSRLDTSSPTQRTSSSCSLTSSLAECKIKTGTDLSVTFLACIQSYVCWCTLGILTDLLGEKCTSFVEMRRDCGTTMGVRKRNLETLTTDSLSPAAPQGIVLHGCLGNITHCQGNLASDLVWA